MRDHQTVAILVLPSAPSPGKKQRHIFPRAWTPPPLDYSDSRHCFLTIRRHRKDSPRLRAGLPRVVRSAGISSSAPYPLTSSGPAPRNPPPQYRPEGAAIGHRPTRSGDARNGMRAPMRPSPANGERPGPDSPDKPRQRRNSESSIMSKDKQDEDRKRRERRRERDARREKEGRSKDGKPRPTRRPHGLDVIDKLDVTGIYGQGCESAINASNSFPMLTRRSVPS